MKSLLQFFFPPPEGSTFEADLAFDGWWPSWTLALAVLLITLTWLGYRWGASTLPRGKRRLLTSLRSLFFLVLLLLLVRPVVLLTINEPVRGTLLVLVDDSASMSQKDKRVEADDRRRAALASGALGPKEIAAAPPEPAPAPLSRTDLLKTLNSNTKLRLWDRLHENANLSFYAFDSTLRQLGAVSEQSGITPSQETTKFFGSLTSKGLSTSTGDALRQLLDEWRGNSASGVLLITDGSANSGSTPEEAAALARDNGVPLYVYGVGISKPKDIMVREISGPRGVFKKEYVEYAVKVRAPGHDGKKLKLVLKENERVVKEEQITIQGDGDNLFQIGYEPEQEGAFQVTASIAVENDEATPDNNATTTRLRVLDEKLNVLYLEQEPRWDFRYLLSTLERDPRLKVQCLLYDGDPIKPEEVGKPFLKEFPATRAELVNNAVIILGDVNPIELGETRMKAIREWVGDLGGAIIFLAGPRNNPFRYGNTPLEPLLPVEINPSLRENEWKTRSPEPIPLVLTPAGEVSPMLRLSPDRGENRKLWREFPGVRWTAGVLRARPGAQVLVEDSKNSDAEGLRPVVSTMPYGQGAVLYFGFDETYRWRSRTGERFYSAIWNQIIQQFAIDRKLASSPRIQLQPDRQEYPLGVRARVSGRLFDEAFRPITDDSVPATLTIRQPDGKELPPKKMRLLSIAGRPGEYELEVETPTEGTYALTTALDPAAATIFEVRNPSLEMAETAMNEPALRALASLSGGEFLREENLDTLPGMIKSRMATLPVVKKLEFAYSPIWLLVLLGCICAEWLLRRLWNLK